MRIIDVGSDRFIVLREMTHDKETPVSTKATFGGVLIRDRNTGRFLICSKIEDIEYEEVRTTTDDS